MLRSHRTSTRRSDAKAKKQKKKKVRRQTGRAQAGAVAQGGRQLDKYAWLQVSTSRFFHFPYLNISFVLGFGSVSAPHGHMCMAIGKALVLQSHLRILYPLPSYTVR